MAKPEHRWVSSWNGDRTCACGWSSGTCYRNGDKKLQAHIESEMQAILLQAQIDATRRR